MSTCWEKLWLINVASRAKFLGEFRLLPSSCGGSAAVSLTVSRSVKKGETKYIDNDHLKKKTFNCLASINESERRFFESNDLSMTPKKSSTHASCERENHHILNFTEYLRNDLRGKFKFRLIFQKNFTSFYLPNSVLSRLSKKIFPPIFCTTISQE